MTALRSPLNKPIRVSRKDQCHRVHIPIFLWFGLAVPVLFGCAPKATPPPALAGEVAILPVNPGDWTVADAEEFYDACINPQRSADQGGKLAELLLTYRGNVRDFRAPAGPDGYVLHIIPLDREYRPLRLEGHFTIILFAEPARRADGATGQPLLIWRIAAQDLDQYWTSTHLLKGYLFRLDWADAAPGAGNYEFLVHLAYKEENEVINVCRALSFREQYGTVSPDAYKTGPDR